jgi:hypothetical protein
MKYELMKLNGIQKKDFIPNGDVGSLLNFVLSLILQNVEAEATPTSGKNAFPDAVASQALPSILAITLTICGFVTITSLVMESAVVRLVMVVSVP